MEEQRINYEKLQELLSSLCFKLYNKKDDIAVWQKTSNDSCYKQLSSADAYPSKCDDSIESDSAWYTPLRSCAIVPSLKFKSISLKSTPKWPQRLNIAPERISDVVGGSGGAFKRDQREWKKRVRHYRRLLPALGSDEIRNVMDMNTGYGGFAAALTNKPLWVMNVVSSHATNTLPVIYDRGLIGTYHDWCEAFSTYPRTYDLLHVDGLFTAESHRCDLKYILLEMDRILRPRGYVVIRESNYFVDAISTISKGMRWGCKKKDTESTVENERILICMKKLWYPQQSST